MTGCRTRMGSFAAPVICGGLFIFVASSLAAAAQNALPLTPPDVPPLAMADMPPLPAPAGPTLEPGRPQAAPADEQSLLSESESVPHEVGRQEIVIAEEPIPAPAAMMAPGVVQPTPKIVYRSDRGARRMLAKFGSVDLVMVTQNPADGCFYEIPLCIPGCCLGEPTVSSRRGLLGRGVVEYCWPCGFKAKVTFRHVRGDVKVSYDG